MSLLDQESTRSSSSASPHARVDSAKEALELGGIEVPGLSPLLFLWRRLGAKGVALCMLFVGFPVGEYSALRYAVYSGLPRMVGGFGLEFKAEEWSLSPFSMRAVARRVEVSAPDSNVPVFTAGEIEFHGSFWTMLRGLPDMLTFHVFGGQQPFNDITVRNGELHLERSLTGRLNWTDFIESVPEARRSEAVEGIYRVNSLRLDDFRVTYVENVPGGSADGVIRTAQAQVKVDEVSGTVSDLVPPREFGERPTRIKINGRSADGLFEITGAMALFPPEGGGGPQPSNDDGIRQVATGSSVGIGGSYPYELSVYLENISAGAYGRMVPVTTIVPVNGVIDGKTTIVQAGGAAECSGAFTMRNVRFAPNPLMVTDPDAVEIVRRGVADVLYSGPFRLCDSGIIPASDTGMAQSRPAALALNRLTQQATAGASPGVRALVARDGRAIDGETVDQTVESLTVALAGELGLRIGGQLGRDVAREAVASRGSGGGGGAGGAVRGTGRALASGAKSVGSGIKRLFGGSKKSGQ